MRFCAWQKSNRFYICTKYWQNPASNQLKPYVLHCSSKMQHWHLFSHIFWLKLYFSWNKKDSATRVWISKCPYLWNQCRSLNYCPGQWHFLQTRIALEISLSSPPSSQLFSPQILTLSTSLKDFLRQTNGHLCLNGNLFPMTCSGWVLPGSSSDLDALFSFVHKRET